MIRRERVGLMIMASVGIALVVLPLIFDLAGANRPFPALLLVPCGAALIAVVAITGWRSFSGTSIATSEITVPSDKLFGYEKKFDVAPESGRLLVYAKNGAGCYSGKITISAQTKETVVEENFVSVRSDSGRGAGVTALVVPFTFSAVPMNGITVIFKLRRNSGNVLLETFFLVIKTRKGERAKGGGNAAGAPESPKKGSKPEKRVRF